ncbi:uncharacterized protein J7T54_003571 [Emericellopsis cladophorae]|uniref:Uncharacterized protein n=1 Tax=Emericellopsis cladophorae TaxID=2686198 RepID=A0A9P9Y3B2_9HYPO|nr:uncharacterized protein J7T54_003571 [Emericellopsis cladophorae]KAI6782560.1 hypothetical protein J7T54_003571 [Emericellopsis cladophorae]
MATLSAVRGIAHALYSNLFVTLPQPKKDTDLSGEIFIVTGANTGLGYESCVWLSRLGAKKIIMAVRTEAKGLDAKTRILAVTGRPDTSIEVWHLDMNSYDSVKRFANRAQGLERLDGVLANAGIMTRNWRLSEGIECSFNVNVVSTFLLYFLLAPKMRESGRNTGNTCRFVVPNSALHFLAPLAELQSTQGTIMERLNDEANSVMGTRYNLTKLLVIYAVRELATLNNGSIIINTPNPSWCKSGLAHEQMAADPGAKQAEALLARSTEEGSRALVHGLLSGDDTNGQYLSNCQVHSPSCQVTGSWGQQTQKEFFRELVEKLETIQTGIKANV